MVKTAPEKYHFNRSLVIKKLSEKDARFFRASFPESF